MGIVVENGGVLTTVQDEGRFGYQAYGVSTSGAMDSHAFHIANLLVGNEMTEGSLLSPGSFPCVPSPASEAGPLL